MTRSEVTEDHVRQPVDHVRDATGARMRGDARRYLALVNDAPDYSLMPPNGGPTRHGVDHSDATVEALEERFAGDGDGGVDLDQQDISGDLAVLVGRAYARTASPDKSVTVA